MKHMNVGMILGAPYPSDIRVKKEATTLITAGYMVNLMCIRRKGEKYTEEVDGIRVYRIDAGKSLYEFAFWDIITSLKFVHPIFKVRLPAFIEENHIEVLHIHDLPLVKTAILAKKRYPVKVVADFHENYPEALKVWFSWKTNPVVRLKNKIFFNYQRWLGFEKFAVHHADFIIAVVEEMKDRLVKIHQANSKKIGVVSNTESKSFIKSNINEHIFDAWNEQYKIVYTGGIGPHRGIDTAIEGMQYLKSYSDIVLIIIGSGSKAVMDKLNNMITTNSLDRNVHLLGYQPFSKFYSYMSMADVNIIPHLKNGHTDNTIPHKLFQSMMSNKPVLVSSSSPLERIVSQENSGLVFKAGSPEDFADKIKMLYNNPELSRQLASNGYQATIEGNYNWENTGKQLLKIYDAI